MSVTAPRRLRAGYTQLLRRGLYVALSPYLPLAPIEAYHREHHCRRRCFPPLVIVWGLVHQRLTNCSDAQCVQQLAAFVDQPIARRSGSWAKARARFELAALSELARSIKPLRKRRRGRRCYILDGTCLPLADTPANQAAYPQPSQQAAGCGFPLMRLVVLIEAATGAVVDWEVGDLGTNEAALARPLWDRLPPRAVVIADRGFASFGFLAGLQARGVDVLVRQHHARRNQRPGQALDWDETWPVSKSHADWWDQVLPDTLTVRVVWHRLPSGRWLTLNTTLTRRQASAAWLAEAYRGRWRIETMFEALKIHLRLEPLAATRPDLALRTLVSAFLALNLVCAARADLARRQGSDPARLSLSSLVGALRASLSRVWNLAGEALAWVLNNADVIPDRPGRHEPRVRKRRPKDYPLMTVPRHTFRERIARGRA